MSLRKEQLLFATGSSRPVIHKTDGKWQVVPAPKNGRYAKHLWTAAQEQCDKLNAQR